MESSDQFICFFCGSLSDEYGCPCSTCELCGNDAHYGYDCPSQVPFVYNQDPCFNQNLDNFPQTSPSFPQQYLCCEDCGGPHATFECQPMNQNFYEPNFCYNSNSSGFDQFQPPQYPVIHQPRQEMSTEMLLAKEKLIKAIRTCFKNNNQSPEEKSIAVLLAEKNLQTLGNTSNQLKQEEHDSSQYWKPPVYYSDDDDDFYRESIDETPPSDAITPDLPITDSLIMEDEHLDTIPKTDSDEEIKSSVKNLNLTPSESDDYSDYVSECDLPFCYNSPDFNNDSEIFSNPLFDSNVDYTSSDDESSSEEDVSVENFKIYSNPLLEFDEEIFSSEINPLYNEVLEDLDLILPGNENDHFNAGSDLIESLLNKDTAITSPKIDFLLEEFAGELALINPIPPGIAETNFDPKEDIRLINNDSLMEEIDIFLAVNDSIQPGIDSDGYDSEEDNLFLEYEPDPGELTRVVMEDIFGEPRVHMPNVLPTHPTLYQDLDFTLSTDFSGSDLVVSFPSRNRNKTFDPGISIEVQSKRFLSLNKFSISFISDPLSPVLETLLPFSSEIEDKVFNPGILVSKEEKSPHLLSHRGFKAFKIIHNFLNESPMMIYGGDMPILDVPYLHFYPP
ncbi:hypothetical protein Tco_0017035 [Tanacetum coccineum]